LVAAVLALPIGRSDLPHAATQDDLASIGLLEQIVAGKP
jgi:hypothetical protein